MRGQTLWDLAIQCYGSVEGVFALIQDNADQLTSLDDELTPGQVLRVRTAPVDRDMATYYKDNDLHPVSGENILLGGAFNNEAFSEGFDNQIATV